MGGLLLFDRGVIVPSCVKYVVDTEGLYATFSMFVMASPSVHERVLNYGTENLDFDFVCCKYVKCFGMLESSLVMTDSTGIAVVLHL